MNKNLAKKQMISERKYRGIIYRLSIKFRFTVCLIVLSQFVSAQYIKWWNPESAEFNVLEGQGFPGKVKSYYDRLPASSEGVVRDAVWGLSRHSAGLMIRFRTNSPEIIIRYGVTSSRYEEPHMPATGVSGIDLYAVSVDGEERWCAGRYTFNDTIQYDYNNLIANDGYDRLGREYRLYLPLYNGVKWLQIGVAGESMFEALKLREDKPIVVYGTSIAQGACATRPGMAWTAILGRKMDRHVVNLGFSGNGIIEEPVLRLMAEIDAKVFILDCLPNLDNAAYHPDKEIRRRLKWAVDYLREQHPLTPIILAEHAGHTQEAMNEVRKEDYQRVNRIQQSVFQELKSEGVRYLYLIKQKEFGQDIETTVDGTHPSDLGMMRYAEGYEKKSREIIKEPAGIYSTERPLAQLREWPVSDWEEQHREVLKLNRGDPPNIIMIGGTITYHGRELWEQLFVNKLVRNIGFSQDRIENVLWRMYHGEIDGYEAEKVFLMIGNNNLQTNTNEEIVAGWRQLIGAIRQRQKRARLYLVGIVPLKDLEERVQLLNFELAGIADDFEAIYIDPGKALLDERGQIIEAFFSDGLHLNDKGYDQLLEGYRPYVE